MVNDLVAQTRYHYDLIAKEWDISRPFLKPERSRLVAGIKKGARVLDVGCGNGVLYGFLSPKSISYVGLDFSKKLVAIARKRAKKFGSKSQAKFILGEATKLPFKDDSFDWVIAFAVYHHLPSLDLRQKALDEAYRVLKPGGKLIVTVWYLVSSYARQKYKIRKKARDIFVFWRATPGEIVSRYVHIFKVAELWNLINKSGFKKIKVERVKHQFAEPKRKATRHIDLVAVAQK